MGIFENGGYSDKAQLIGPLIGMAIERDVLPKIDWNNWSIEEFVYLAASEAELIALREHRHLRRKE